MQGGGQRVTLNVHPLQVLSALVPETWSLIGLEFID